MVKRSGVDVVAAASRGHALPSPGLKEAPVLELMCSHFVLTLAAKQGPRFNVRRDLNGLLSLTGRHLVWPAPVLQRLREFLGRRCAGNEIWKGVENFDGRTLLERHGVWRGPYEEGTLFFYLDEYAKDQPKDLLSVLGGHARLARRSADASSRRWSRRTSTRSPACCSSTRPSARCCCTARWRATSATCASLLVEFKVNNAPEAYAAIAEVAGVNASEVGEALRAGSRLERIGLVENLISEHNITDLADLMKVSEKLPPVLMREYRDHNELMAVFTRPVRQERAVGARLLLRRATTRRC